ncbi:MAG: DNA repair protein RecN [Pedosphaera sp.]|nr:DNA repair protein RecN [Pedosphaera sp.]
MLTTLRIKNLALVEDLTLELQSGYNVITGETGAGKSIIIGALNLILGERADRTLIRSGSDSCSVEALFDIASFQVPLRSFLEENGLEPCEENQLVVKRTFTAAGTNRQFVNGSPTTLQVLSSIGEGLVDIHGPHDHQSLLHPVRQLAILDAFGSLRPLRESFAKLVRQRSALDDEKVALIVDEKAYAQQLDLLRFQANEIKAAKLHPDEEPQLHEEYQRASHAAKLLQLTQTAVGLLTEDENSLLDRAGALGRTLQEIQRIDPAADPLLSLHSQAVGPLQDLQNEISRYADRLEIDPIRLQELEERLNMVQSLKRKYGSSLEEIIAFGADALQKLILLEQRDVELIRINDDLKRTNTELSRIGQELSTQRRKIIPKLCKAVVKQLLDLGFKQSHFDIAISTESQISNLKSQIPLSGLDSIEFQFAPNAGEPLRPLRAIASSGEMARVMLALKTVLAAEDEIPVLVFDEVDANVGGETAHAVGQKMCQISRQRQVLCITHLAPVAACASTHYVVTKHLKAGRTISEIRQLDGSARVEELARMLGGQSEAARKHAEALLKTEAAP